MAIVMEKITHRLRGLFVSPVFWQGLILVGAAFCIYLRSLHGQFLWDDDDYVTKNLALRSFSGLADIWFHPGNLSQYYPLTYTSFWIDYHLWGLQPFGYHVVNHLLHAGVAFLLWRLLDHLKIKYAWFVALLFAFHPVHVESVAWITERKNLLSGCIGLLSAIAYLRGRHLLAYVVFLGALGSKTIVATLPPVLFILLWWQKGKVSKEDWVRLTIFMLTALVVSSVSVSLESLHVFRMKTRDWDYSFLDRVLIAGRAICFYFFKLLWPHPLVFFYPRWTIDPRQWVQWVYPAACVLAAAVLWVARKRIGRGPFAAFAIFGIMLFPALGFKNYYPMRYALVADHFQYLASIAGIVLWVAFFAAFLKNERLRIFSACLILVIFAVLNWGRQAAFLSLEALWVDTLRKNPASWMVHNNYGALLMDRGDREQAKAHLAEAIRLKPENSSDSFENLGLLSFKEGDLQKAMSYYQKALDLRPGYSFYHLNMGTLYLELGKTEEAILEYQHALGLNPKFGEAYFSLGNIFLQKGDYAEAEEMLRQAVLFTPDFANAYTTLGFICSKLEKRTEAIQLYRTSLELDPKQPFAHNNLANALSAKGLFEEANKHYQDAIALEPESFQFRFNFADSLQREGKADEAEKYYQEAQRLQASGASQKTDPRILTQPTPQADPA